MQPLKSRVERLEQQGDTETAFMVVVGKATADQQRLIDQGKVKLLIEMPDNRRGDYGGTGSVQLCNINYIYQ